MRPWQVERLGREHDRSSFECGHPSLDVFVRELATQYEKRDVGRTYVLVRQGDPRVLGFYTLASGSVSFASVPPGRKLPRHPVPVILLGRLAVDLSLRGQGLGQFLLMDALTRCLELGDQLGVHAVEVNAIDQSAREFYQKYGFVPLLDDAFHLYLPLCQVRQSLR